MERIADPRCLSQYAQPAVRTYALEFLDQRADRLAHRVALGERVEHMSVRTDGVPIPAVKHRRRIVRRRNRLLGLPQVPCEAPLTASCSP